MHQYFFITAMILMLSSCVNSNNDRHSKAESLSSERDSAELVHVQESSKYEQLDLSMAKEYNKKVAKNNEKIVAIPPTASSSQATSSSQRQEIDPRSAEAKHKKMMNQANIEHQALRRGASGRKKDYAQPTMGQGLTW